ncbi:hypothetical protein E2562_008423 [Oryza meyeriana var. granulata]|uniref:Gnk2-homologous domain-containing protein n=1 Tax=Oryza meyeriana var. granulata TaxID=110450 RepID=A0A6G1EHD8_9ORYZ|nr:hypothetical protein E2562_008423 [Oryza meyeriana var. granulata]
MATSSSPVAVLLLLVVLVVAAPSPCSAVDPLVPRASAGYYATATAGRGDSAIWGLAQCRGDIPASDCALCVSAAARQLATACRGRADARVWYDYCFVRYDDVDFRGLPDTGYALILLNTQNATDPEAFEDGVTIYGLGWCTRDIAAADCGLCVAQAVAEMPNYCRFRRGCRVLYSSCMARYETYPFFFPLDGQDAGDASTAGDYDKVVLNPYIICVVEGVALI